MTACARRAFVVFSFVVASIALARPAHAQRAANDKVEWKDGQWPRVSAWEAAGVFALTGVSLIIERRVNGVSWEEKGLEVPLLDPSARYLLRGRTRKVQEVFGGISNIGWRMMAFFPYVDVLGTLAIHRNFDVAGQMALIDAEALTLSGFTFLLASRLTGRARPYRSDCDSERDQTTSRGCDVVDNRSFYSGHSAAAFTSAGLTCVHHEHLPLYGGGPVEAWACVWALSVATATGAFRLVADSHYASDVLIGAGVGWFYGYVMPKLLHYKSLRPAAQERKVGRPTWMPAFDLLDGGGLLTVRATL